MNRQLQARLSE